MLEHESNISVNDEAAEANACNAASANTDGSDKLAGGQLQLLQQQTGAAQLNMSLEEIIKLLDAVLSVRKMLSSACSPPIDNVINANLVPGLVSSLSLSDWPQLQFEAAWALAIIASGTSAQTRHVVESGAILPFVALLSSSNSDVCQNAVWALGNIAGDGAELRDLTPTVCQFSTLSSSTARSKCRRRPPILCPTSRPALRCRSRR
jgi:hypothetical protein